MCNTPDIRRLCNVLGTLAGHRYAETRRRPNRRTKQVYLLASEVSTKERQTQSFLRFFCTEIPAIKE